eukprot:TRINITY_DN4781_c0_g1_i1.p2 TRINITY_DN4781_c0_g1~~TRINITY_DN4781_c0_g1_i1.p2  ORF type:complete len:101 (+),score=10.23 TRINITY_DN4781_c0_g1_i1:120-422(+)
MPSHAFKLYLLMLPKKIFAVDEAIKQRKHAERQQYCVPKLKRSTSEPVRSVVGALLDENQTRTSLRPNTETTLYTKNYIDQEAALNQVPIDYDNFVDCVV